MATELISLGILFLCAIIGGIIAARFKQPAVLGLLVVGAVIGPNALNFVKDINMIRLMADFGAILILFIIGLEFDLSKLFKSGIRPVIIGLFKFGIVTFLGYEAILLMGFSVKTALFVGVILSFSSTVVIIKILEQKEMINRKEVPLLIAILIIEDVLAVLALTFFSGVKNQKIGLLSTFEHIVFSIAILLICYFVMMKLLKHGVRIIINNSKDDSVLTFLSLGIGVSFSYFASYLGLTPSAGAFLAGSLIASLPNAKEYRNAIHPYAIIFTSIFFISMGTLIDFRAVKENFLLIVVLILIVFISRLLTIGFLTFLFANFKEEQPFFSSIAMLPIGEFSLLVAKESEKFGLGIDLVTITASIIFISAIAMPFCLNYSKHLDPLFKKRMPIRTKLRMERVSNYMRKFFDQMEIETFFTKKLRAEGKTALSLLTTIVILFFIFRRAGLLTKNYHPFLEYAVFAFGGGIILYITSITYKKLKSIHHTLSVILTNVDSSRNLKKCTSILNNLFIGGTLLSAAVLLPFIIFVLNISIATINLVPLIFITGAFYYVKNTIALIDGPSNTSIYEAQATVS